MIEEKIIEEISKKYTKFGPRRGRWNGQKNPNYTLFSFHWLVLDKEIIETFVKYGLYTNISEAIKHYIKNGIDNDLEKVKQRLELRNFNLINPLQEGSIPEDKIREKLVKKQIIQEEN
ncbi:MAG: hypothetical protein ACFE8A_13405 [Candidatus Hodarchaeota archaeon]